jgi:uncharacterized membrane protein
MATEQQEREASDHRHRNTKIAYIATIIAAVATVIAFMALSFALVNHHMVSDCHAIVFTDLTGEEAPNWDDINED